MARIHDPREVTDTDAQVASFVCAPDGEFPNNPQLPVLHYRAALRLPRRGDPASVIEQVFAAHGWSESWRDTVYDYAHYHSSAHEVLGCYQGEAELQVGGSAGPHVRLEQGDVLVLPAGTAHRKLREEAGFRVVGAYAGGRSYDMCRGGQEEQTRTVGRVRSVPLPDADPVFGTGGPLTERWARPRT